MSVPDAVLAHEIATRVRGTAPLAISRFTTGSMHYVFEASFAGGPPLVVRIAADYGKAAMRGAAHLSYLLRPLGVPLPAILAHDLDAEFPWLVLERLPGTDLGDVLATLDRPQLATIADRVAAAQAIVAQTPGAGRYGYAVTPEAAPHERWLDVLAGHLDRSRSRIVAATLFDPGLADRVALAIKHHHYAIAHVPATPFLHDTTIKNVIIAADGTFSGIVDVDDLCFGDPRYAIALTAASLLARNAGTHYTDRWLARAGAEDDALFGLYIALFLLDFMSEHGQHFNGNQPASLPAQRTHLEHLFLAACTRAA